MKRHLFLSGPAFSGKSRLIRKQLGSGLQNAGGFCTELCKAPDGSVLGCAMIPTAAAGGVQGLERELFLDMRSFPPAHDSEVFRNLGVRLLDEAAWYPFAVLDEITHGADDETERKIDDITNSILTYSAPQNFRGTDSVEIQFDRNFERMCHIISYHLNVSPKDYTVTEYYSAFNYIKEIIKAKKMPAKFK